MSRMAIRTKWCCLCGQEIEVLGPLGRRVHGRCRGCGAMWSWAKGGAK